MKKENIYRKNRIRKILDSENTLQTICLSEQGWHDAAIVPYGGIPMDPATMVLHYAQETFEGLKAYRTAEGKIQLFRPEMNARRMIKSNERLCMPGVPEEMFVEAVKALVKAQEDC